MYLVNPITMTDSIMTNTIAEPDTTLTGDLAEVEWDSGTAYNTGDRVIKASTHVLYESASDSNTDDPEDGVLLTPQTWVAVSPTNKYRMFDSLASTATTQTDDIVVTITPDTICNVLACFNTTSGNINITMTEPDAGEIYNEDVSLVDNSQITSWYNYFFEPIINKSEFIVVDLPSYKNATITVTFSSEVGIENSVGVLAMGRELELGVTQYGTSFKLQDFSRKETDDYGNWTIVRRGTSKIVDFDVYCPTKRAQYVFERLAEVSTVPCIWYGSGTSIDSSLVYGYYTDGNITISNPQTSSVTISVEGLV